VTDVTNAQEAGQDGLELFDRFRQHGKYAQLRGLRANSFQSIDRILLNSQLFLEARRIFLETLKLLNLRVQAFAAQGPQCNGPGVAFDDDVVAGPLWVLPHDDRVNRNPAVRHDGVAQCGHFIDIGDTALQVLLQAQVEQRCVVVVAGRILWRNTGVVRVQIDGVERDELGLLEIADGGSVVRHVVAP
jgi:hypothetical protein